jgi:hypothetical protein
LGNCEKLCLGDDILNNFDDKAVNDFIEEGLKAIDEETKTDEDIREISRLIKEELIRNTAKGLETRITDLNGNWKLEYAIYKKYGTTIVGLACYNETRMLMAPKYRPLILEGEVDEDFGPEEALEAVVTAFVAKQFGVFRAEELKD